MGYADGKMGREGRGLGAEGEGRSDRGLLEDDKTTYETLDEEDRSAQQTGKWIPWFLRFREDEEIQVDNRGDSKMVAGQNKGSSSGVGSSQCWMFLVGPRRWFH